MPGEAPQLLAAIEADAVRLAVLVLAEDGPGDLSTEVSGPTAEPGSGRIEFRSAGVLAGLPYADAVARSAGCRTQWLAARGQFVSAGAVGRVFGALNQLLRIERPLLNLLQRASGIAGRTRRYVDAVAGTGCTVLHTRKTAPGLRFFDVAAVVDGGGGVHRLDLAQTVMIKDNHWRLLARSGRTLAEALDLARRRGARACQVEVETETQVREACEAGADRLLIDNQLPATVARWVTLARARRPEIQIEASGGITLDTVHSYAQAGADYVSIGEITHSPAAADLAFELD